MISVALDLSFFIAQNGLGHNKEIINFLLSIPHISCAQGTSPWRTALLYSLHIHGLDIDCSSGSSLLIQNNGIGTKQNVHLMVIHPFSWYYLSTSVLWHCPTCMEAPDNTEPRIRNRFINLSYFLQPTGGLEPSKGSDAPLTTVVIFLSMTNSMRELLGE